MLPLGCYRFPNVTGPFAVHDDPRMARLRAAYPRWGARPHPAGGVALTPHGTMVADTASEPLICEDGLEWYAPRQLPQLYDLAREQIPQPAVDVDLRRVGRVSLPLGVGPCFALGPQKGKPSSEYGRLVARLWEISIDRDRQWTSEDDRLAERVIFLAFQQCYHLSWEIWCQMAVYDLDEGHLILEGVYGLDPKASSGGGPT